MKLSIVPMTWIIPTLAAVFITTGCTKKENSAQNSAQTAAPAAAQSDLGIGPVKSLTLPAEIDSAMVAKGKTAFEAKCSACHKFGERYVGPDLKDVTKRRKPEWIMNMILNPVEMTQKDEKAKELLGEYMTQMTFQNVSEDEARQILEFLRDKDK